MSVSACKKALLCVCVMSFVAPASGMQWVVAKLFGSSSGERKDEIVPYVRESPEILMGRLARLVSGKECTASKEWVKYLGFSRKKFYCIAPELVLGCYSVPRMLYAPQLTQGVLDEAQKYFDKNSFYIVVDSHDTTMEKLHEGYKKTDFAVMWSPYAKESFCKDDKLDNMIVERVTTQEQLCDWFDVMGDGKDSKAAHALAQEHFGVLNNSTMYLLLGRCYKAKNIYVPCAVSMLVMDGDKAHIVKLKNRASDKEEKDKVSAYILKQSLIFAQQDVKFDKVITCASFQRQPFYEDRGFKTVQHLMYYEKNQNK